MSQEKKRWDPRGSKLFQINLAFLDVRLVIGISMNIFLFFLFFFGFVFNIVVGLNVCEFNKTYEILGRPLSDPIACETHGASQERQTSRVVCIGLLILNPKTVPNMPVYKPDSLFQEQLGV